MNILVVSTENISRSSMAEGFFKKYLDENSIVKSAGIFATKGNTPSGYSAIVMKELGIDIYDYKSIPISKDLIRECDLVLTMTKEEKELIYKTTKSLSKKIFTMKEYAFGKEEDILDTTNKSLLEYRKTVEEIEKCVKEISKKEK